MTTHITKTWFDGEKVVTQEIPESEVYKQAPEVGGRMTRDDIIRMAREAGYDPNDGGVFKFDDFDFERFAALVAAAERERLKSAAECFRMCEHKGVCDEKAKSNEADCTAVLGKG
jgi:hypothetical protein